MSRIGRFTKDDHDVKRYVVDYEDWLHSEENIVSVIVTNESDPADGFFVEGFMVDESGKQVVYFVSGGLPGSEYDAVITITTHMGQVKQDWITHVVT